MPLYFIYITLGLLTSLIAFTLLHFYKLERQHDKLIQMESRWTDINRLLNQLHDARVIDQRHTAANKEQLLLELNTYRQQFDRHQLRPCAARHLLAAVCASIRWRGGVLPVQSDRKLVRQQWHERWQHTGRSASAMLVRNF